MKLFCQNRRWIEEYKCKKKPYTHIHPLRSAPLFHIKALQQLEQLLNRQLGIQQKSEVIQRRGVGGEIHLRGLLYIITSELHSSHRTAAPANQCGAKSSILCLSVTKPWISDYCDNNFICLSVVQVLDHGSYFFFFLADVQLSVQTIQDPQPRVCLSLNVTFKNCLMSASSLAFQLYVRWLMVLNTTIPISLNLCCYGEDASQSCKSVP